MFRKSKLSVAILAAAGTLVAGQVIAEGSSIDEVVVTGIRGSLERAMDTKRDASGVVDAISAEDMGKFPDTNLAESLQRISGVSINRVNGEGSEVTVRGFGGGFNHIPGPGQIIGGIFVAGDLRTQNIAGQGVKVQIGPRHGRDKYGRHNNAGHKQTGQL